MECVHGIKGGMQGGGGVAGGGGGGLNDVHYNRLYDIFFTINVQCFLFFYLLYNCSIFLL